MSNRSLFTTLAQRFLPSATTKNDAHGAAYRLAPKAALVQLATTGCLSRTYYASGEKQLDQVIALAAEVPPEFIAKLALYAKERGKMKDMPALLLAILSTRAPLFAWRIAARILVNGKMLRNYVQILRSGRTGRRSLGTAPKRIVHATFDRWTDDEVFRASHGTSPRLVDILKMTHPKPKTDSRRALYGYLLGRPYAAEHLPALVRQFEFWKNGASIEMPALPFEMTAGFATTPAAWIEIAKAASWTTTRMNLNAFCRHGVFESQEVVELVAKRLRDPESIARANAFPYQLFMTWKAILPEVPKPLKDAIGDAAEVAMRNVPEIAGRVVICPDVSGSMSTAITGTARGPSSGMRAVDVAALVAAAIVRKNPSAHVMPFDTAVRNVRFAAEEPVFANAERFAKVGGGGTSCSAPLLEILKKKMKVDLVILVSDNESWCDGMKNGSPTKTLATWNAVKAANKRARLVCLDLCPNTTTQAIDRDDVLNIGGFSDEVFDLIREFANGSMTSDHWVGVVERMEL